MSDLGMFDGYTPGPWRSIGLDDSDARLIELGPSDSELVVANEADCALLERAPVLLERVRELELALGRLVRSSHVYVNAGHTEYMCSHCGAGMDNGGHSAGCSVGMARAVLESDWLE